MQRTDSELLQLLRQGDQSAFGELARRFAPMVYSSALRQVRNHHMAEDVTQAVFLLFSQKAAAISPKASVGGWLFTTTRFAAANAVKVARRRERHEQMAARDEQADTSPEPAWKEVRDQLDTALAHLGKPERELLVMRFLRGLSLAEVGQAIGATEEAARKRIARAMDQLRGVLAQGGTACSLVALERLLESHAIEQVPQAFLHSIATAAQANAAPFVVEIAKGASRTVFWAKGRIAAMVIAGAAVLGGGTYLVTQVVSEPAGRIVPDMRPQIGDDEVNWKSPLSVASACVRYALTPEPEKFRETLYTANADEERFADALTEVFANAQELNDLAKARFGPDAMVGPISSRDELQKLASRQWGAKDEGDMVAVYLPPGLNPRLQYLQKVDGRFKVMIYKTMGPTLGPRLSAAELADRMSATASAMQDTARELMAGKFQTPDEARAYLTRQTDVTLAAKTKR